MNNKPVGAVKVIEIMDAVDYFHSHGSPSQGGLFVDGKHLFVVGGKGKGFKQIADVPDSYVVNDDVEIGIGNKIPLWLFGFLY